MPIYSRAFTSTVGPGHTFGGVGVGSWEEGIWDYKELPHAAAKIESDSEVGASWTYDAASRTMVSYDTPAMVQEKISYVKEHGLGGAMFWEASSDKGGAESLILTARDSLGSLEDKRNWLNYPGSVYDNIRTGSV